jgi:energy-coupling factor transporter ATP-binding protein EcfA2
MTASLVRKHTLEKTVIEVHELSKSYHGKLVVDRLSFRVQPGRVTGFLGPNGAGKSTTMRLIVGLDHPVSGSATIGGRPYAELSRPLRVVGALLDAESVHPGRSAYHHGGSATSSISSACTTSLRTVPAHSPWACGNGWALRSRCSGIRGS